MRQSGLFASLRAFWADPAQRRVLMWVLAFAGALILGYGAVQAVRAQLDYRDRGDDVRAAERQAVALEQSLGLNYNPGDAPALTPTVAATPPAAGATTPLVEPTPAAATPSDAAGPALSQNDALLLFTLRSQVRKAETAQAQAYNRRSDAIQIMGIGVIVLALAYVVAPTGRRAVEIPPGHGPRG